MYTNGGGDLRATWVLGTPDVRLSGWVDATERKTVRLE